MLGLPKYTEISKPIFKKNLYLKFNVTSKAQEAFDADIAKITIVNEISPMSTSVAAGETVKGFFAVLVQLKKEDFSDKNIELLSKYIPHKTVYALEFDGRIALAVYETKLIKTQFQPAEDINLSIQGLNLDEVWSNIVHTVQGGEWDENLSVTENVEHQIEIENILKEISKLEKQIKNEPQPKKKFELVQKLNALKQRLSK